jgi:hypothetical protein
MPTDPQHIEIGDPRRRQAQDMTDVRKRLDTAERTPRVQTGSTAPTNDCRPGTFYVDSTASKLYVSMGGGVWKSVLLS